MSYEVNALRGLLIGLPTNLVLDFGVLAGATTGNSILHAYDASGCGGIFGDGDPVTLHAVFDVTDLVISSP